MKYVLLATYKDSFKANLMKGKLEDHGISCFLTNEHTTATLTNSYVMDVAINLMIDKKDTEAAVEIIKKSEKLDKINPTACPECLSPHIKKRKGIIKNSFLMLLTALFWVPSPNSSYNYICAECGIKF